MPESVCEWTQSSLALAQTRPTGSQKKKKKKKGQEGREGIKERMTDMMQILKIGNKK